MSTNVYPRHYFTEQVPRYISTQDVEDKGAKMVIDACIHKTLCKLENQNNPLKRFRKSNHWTCQDVADRMKVGMQRYSKIELGKQKPNAAEQEAINNLFGSEILQWLMEPYNNKDKKE